MAEVINVNKYISLNKLQEVSDPRMFSNNYYNEDPIPSQKGLFSYEIFGPKYSDVRNNTWAYINLGVEILHPTVLIMLDKISTAFRKIVLRERRYILQDGELIPSGDKAEGSFGVQFLKKALREIDWKKIPRYEDKKEFINKIKQYDDVLMFPNKWLVLPAGLRDFNFRDGKMMYDEMNDLYNDLIQSTSSGTPQESTLKFLLNTDDLTGIGKETLIQSQVLKLSEFFLNKVSTKKGLIRGALIKKKTDFVARLVASALPEVPINSAVIPWGALLNIFAPFIIHEIENDDAFKKILFGDTKYVSMDEYSNHFQYIFKNMEIISKKHPNMKKRYLEILHKVLNENELVATFKRDPAFGNTSWWTVYPIINSSDVYNLTVNSLYYNPIGGDSINCAAVFSVAPDHKIKLHKNTYIKFKNESACYMPLSYFHAKVSKNNRAYFNI